jgi:hypothetical protein
MMVRPVVNIILPAECELHGQVCGDSIVVIYLI